MSSLLRLVIAVVLFSAFQVSSLRAQPEPRPDPLDPTAEHDRWETQPRDTVRDFRAYIASFDGPDDNDGDGESDLWGMPEWVSYEIRSATDHKPYESRPSTWMTDRQLYEDGIAPRDQSYVRSGYDRGHMCMREIARRFGKNADWNSHDVLNAVPQVHEFNAGHWLSLEKWTGIWANTYGKVWVICGPVVVNRAGNRRSSNWIGEDGEKTVVVPQKLFKIVVKETDNPRRPDVLAFIYDNDASLGDSSLATDHAPYLVSVREIENLTGLDFFTGLSRPDQNSIETQTANHLWPGPDGHDSERIRSFALGAPDATSPVFMMAEIDRLYGADVSEEREPKEIQTYNETAVSCPCRLRLCRWRHRCHCR